MVPSMNSVPGAGLSRSEIRRKVMKERRLVAVKTNSIRKVCGTVYPSDVPCSVKTARSSGWRDSDCYIGRYCVVGLTFGKGCCCRDR